MSWLASRPALLVLIAGFLCGAALYALIDLV